MKLDSVMHKLTGCKNAKFIWWMNIGAEAYWGEDSNALLPRISNKSSTYMVNRTEQLCFLLAGSEDIVIQREQPPEILRESLISMGFSNPKVYIPQGTDVSEDNIISELILKDGALIEKIQALKKESSDRNVILTPYAITSLEDKISEQTGCQLAGANGSITSSVNSKVNARLLAAELELPATEGYICRTAEEVKKAVSALNDAANFKPIIVKEAYGASGKGMFIIDSHKSHELFLSILNRKKNSDKKFEVIVERWYDTLADLNYQIYINELGKISYIKPKFQLNRGAVYTGSEFCTDTMLSYEQRLYYEECAEKIGKKLWEKGYHGFASIDSIITAEKNIIPIIEINGRFSLSTYISFVPEACGLDKLYRNKYYNISYGIAIEKIIKEASSSMYTPERGEGMIIYSFAEAKRQSDQGRLFVLYVSDTKERLDFIEKRLCSIINC